MFERIRHEPALAVALFQAALVVAVNFGWELSTQQMSAVVALAAAAAALFVRQHVTPLPPKADGPGDHEPTALPANPAAAPTPATDGVVEPAPTA